MKHVDGEGSTLFLPLISFGQLGHLLCFVSHFSPQIGILYLSPA